MSKEVWVKKKRGNGKVGHVYFCNGKCVQDYLNTKQWAQLESQIKNGQVIVEEFDSANVEAMQKENAVYQGKHQTIESRKNAALRALVEREAIQIMIETNGTSEALELALAIENQKIIAARQAIKQLETELE